MQIQIEVLQSKIVSVPSPKGGYQKAEVSYKDLGNGKVAAKQVMSFTKPVVFATFANAKPGEQYTVEMEKNGQYWDWIGVTKGATAPVMSAESTNYSSKTTNAAPKSNYETPAERAARQVLIVKQSSLSVAASLLSVGAKSPPNSDEVINLAQKFTDWVFDNKIDGVEALAAMPNDLNDMPQ